MSLAALSAAANSGASQKELKQTFQDAVAGVFFGEILKSLWSTVGKPEYLHGGQAEEMFRQQMNQETAKQLASSQGGSLVTELYQRFEAGVKARQNASEPANGSTQSRQPFLQDDSAKSTQPILEAQASQQASVGTIPTEVIFPTFRK